MEYRIMTHYELDASKLQNKIWHSHIFINGITAITIKTNNPVFNKLIAYRKAHKSSLKYNWVHLKYRV